RTRPSPFNLTTPQPHVHAFQPTYTSLAPNRILTPVEPSHKPFQNHGHNGAPTASRSGTQRKPPPVPLSINTRIAPPTADCDMTMSDAPRSVPQQAIGPPYGPDYGVAQASSQTQTNGATGSNHSSRAGTPIYGHMNIDPWSDVSTQPVHNVPPLHPCPLQQPLYEREEWFTRRLPSPISESDISPTTRVFERDGVEWPDSVLFPSLLPQNNNNNNNGTTTAPCARDSAGTGHPLMLPGDYELGVGYLGEKIFFSKGFRTDCEKCQRRVPGHTSHFVRVQSPSQLC
ncbi:hypothetical protein KEM55_001419, partial [Ascosphaera atra]